MIRFTKLVFVVYILCRQICLYGQDWRPMQYLGDSIFYNRIGDVNYQFFYKNGIKYQMNMLDTNNHLYNLYSEYQGLRLNLQLTPAYEISRIEILKDDQEFFAFDYYDSPFYSVYGYGFPRNRFFAINEEGCLRYYTEEVDNQWDGCLMVIDDCDKLKEYSEFTKGVRNGWYLEYNERYELSKCEYYEMGVLVASY